MTKKATQLSGAQKERDAILAHVRLVRLVFNPTGVTYGTLDELILWLKGRTKRFNAKPGGLGKKPKKVKADFDALGIP